MENQNEELGTSVQEEEVSDLNTETTVDEQDTQDENQELSKLKELAQNQKIRAEKAERKLKELSKVEKPVEIQTQSSALSQKDLIAVINAKVSDEDIDEVVDYAKLKKISVTEALKTNFIKSFLADKDEQRKVAKATNIGNNRRGSSQVSEEALEAQALKGNIPESDEEMRRLISHRIKQKR